MEIPIGPYLNTRTLKLFLATSTDVVINWLKNSAANFAPSRNDGTPVNQLMSIRSWFNVYETTGVGQTESAAKIDSVIQIAELMKQYYGISCLGLNKLPTCTKSIDGLSHAIYTAENSSIFPMVQIEKLSVLGYFMDTGDSKPPLEMLDDISSILLTRPREHKTRKKDMHVSTHFLALYCSTGLGLTAEDAKMRSVNNMLNTLRKVCGFVPMPEPPTMRDPMEPFETVGRMCLWFPINDQYKIKLIEYFLVTSTVSYSIQLNELAALMKVVVKYSDQGDINKLGVACEFGPHVTVGVGDTKMLSVFRSREAMVNKLKLVCGYSQYRQEFVPIDCIDDPATMEIRWKDKDCGKLKATIRSSLVEHPWDRPTPAEHRDPMSNKNHTTLTHCISVGEPIEIVLREGVTMKGMFRPNLGRSQDSRPLQFSDKRRRLNQSQISVMEGLAEN